MTHIAIQETLDGKVVEWMEKVATNVPGLIEGRINGRNHDQPRVAHVR
jgi:hypothetical protein